jgi:RNA-binding protein 25
MLLEWLLKDYHLQPTAPPGGAAAPPGVAPPGIAHGQGPPALGGPRPLPSGWQAPANMPNFNFNAPVIRLGTQSGKPMDGPAGGRRENAAMPARRGLGMDRDGDRRDGIQQVIPPSREEIARTIFVGNIPDGVGGDEGMERLLETAGKLVRWLRVIDANNKPQTFGFAEFADAQSLETAAEIFKDVKVPTKRQKPGEVKKDEDGEVETTKLQVMVDAASIKYAEEWSKTRNEDENTVQFRLDTAKEALSHVLASFFNPPNIAQPDYGGDTTMQDVPTQDNDVEVAFVNLATGEDELADIPAEMREIVAAEIAAFRDRSNQRDRERLRREEEIEAEERRRNGRRASPPPKAPTGPGGANGIPLGPRAERGVQGAPSGPKGSQFPRDYQGGVNFINGGAINGGVYYNREDEDDSASDEELERRRKKKRDDELEEAYQKQLARWLKTEARTEITLGRSSDRVKNQEAEQQAARDAQAKLFAEFDDDDEATGKRHLYYSDHGEYMRERKKVREKEAREDELDRQQEQRELAAQDKQREHARGQADAFLDQQAEEIMRTQEHHEPAAHFKISLGAAAKKLEQTAAPRRTAADVENLLEDEEPTDQPGAKKRTLIPINYDAAVRANLTEEEVVEAQKQLAREISNDKDGLWKWSVSWSHLPEKNIDKDIREWTANKALELTGLQDEDLVDAVVAHLRKRGAPQALVEDLEPVSILDVHVSYCFTNDPRFSTKRQSLLSRSFGVWSSITARRRSVASNKCLHPDRTAGHQVRLRGKGAHHGLQTTSSTRNSICLKRQRLNHWMVFFEIAIDVL